MSEKSLWDCYNGLLLGADVDRIRKLLVRYELFKESLNVPGDIVECGVFKGVGFMYWLKLLKIYASGSTKKVIGFDTFSSFADSLLDYEKKSAGSFTNEAEFEGVNPDEILKAADEAGLGDMAELIDGDINETAKKYVESNPGFRISLLHLDFDTYHGTLHALENFYKLVVPGGLIVLDEYAQRGWGESDAVDEFFEGKSVSIRTVEHSSQPTAYIIKT